MVTLHMPTAGTFCVPAALEIITGEDPYSVVFPALNRHGGAQSLTEPVAGAHMSAARAALEEMGWIVRGYIGPALRATVSSWAARRPQHVVLVATGAHDPHALVLHAGRVHDSWHPAGLPAAEHPFHSARVVWAAIVERTPT